MRLNRPVYLNTLRWFLDSPARLMAAGLMAFLTYLAVSGVAHLEVNGVASSGLFSTPEALAGAGDKVLVLLAWILGVGVIRREVASGAIQLVLLRPLSRASYVLSKWAAVATLDLAFLVFCYAVLLMRGGFAAGDLAGLFLAQAVQVLALSAVLTFLSAVPFNLGEMGLLLLAVVGLLIAGHYAESLDLAPLRFLVDFGYKALFPRVGVFLADGAGGIPASLAFNACVTAAALGLGMLLLKRREFSYAEAGA